LAMQVPSVAASFRQGINTESSHSLLTG